VCTGATIPAPTRKIEPNAGDAPSEDRRYNEAERYANLYRPSQVDPARVCKTSKRARSGWMPRENAWKMPE